MGIDVAWVDERHEQKQVVIDPQQVLARLATSRWPKLTSSVCLRFVDPWGDAVFNQAQNKDLLRELSIEVREESDPQVRAHLQKVINLVELARNEVHTYIKFIGD
jgi:hypothetical protein